MPAATFRNPTPSSMVDKPAVFGSEEHDPPRSVPSSELQLDVQQSMPNKRALLFNGLLGSPRVLVTQIGCLMLLIPLLMVVAAVPAGLMSYHPPLQVFSILAFTQGVLTLQPTHTKADKARGLALHQVFQIFGLAITIAGVVFIIVDTARSDSPHFDSLHGQFGLATFILLILQSSMGIFIAWDPSMRLLGDESKAKSFWKYHRALGYLILPVTLITAAVAVTSTDYILGQSTIAERSVMVAGLAFIAAGLWSGVSLRKFRSKRATA